MRDGVIARFMWTLVIPGACLDTYCALNEITPKRTITMVGSYRFISSYH